MHWTIAGIAIGMREVVVGLVLLLAGYIVFLLLRMRGIGAAATAPEVAQPERVAPAEVPPAPMPTLDELRAEPLAPRYVPPAPPPASMADRAAQASMERELMQLRDEVDTMRGELAALRADMSRELAHVRAGQTVAPIYGDAMQMAVAGYDASMIAERCGIARAEAELVVALAKSQG